MLGLADHPRLCERNAHAVQARRLTAWAKSPAKSAQADRLRRAILPTLHRLESLRQRVRAAREQAEIDADRDEGIAPRDEALRLLLVRGEDAGGLADRLEPSHRVLQRRLHLRVAPIADMAERGGEVVRTDE